jgi:hypothetical protein
LARGRASRVRAPPRRQPDSRAVLRSSTGQARRSPRFSLGSASPTRLTPMPFPSA